ncbi:hypothetical protein O3P69_006857 [Scylla paramamosain]|uniref:Ionotropic glutamate receptor C-terminal domain-containing protein n=1 Tax=Scylla paramamosain TaxID=85552 RepID=A0AAW0U2W8_SCYPA
MSVSTVARLSCRGGSTLGGTRAAVGWTSFLWAYVHPLAQPSAWLPRGGVRLVAGVWLLLTLVLAQMYRSNLKAMMILPRLPLPFDSLEELIESGISCYVVSSTKFHNAILGADSDSQFGRLRGQLVVHNDLPRATRDLIQGKHAAIAAHFSLLNIVHSIFRNTGTCPLYFASETIQPEWNYFLYQKASSWRPKVDVM